MATWKSFINGLASAGALAGTERIGLIKDPTGTPLSRYATPDTIATRVAAKLGLREVLTANRTYYVSTTGSDSNDGLSAGAPLATLVKAVDLCYSIDPNGYVVTIQLADGNYTAGVAVNRPLVGGGALYITGNVADPSAVTITTPSDVIALYNGTRVEAKGLKLKCSGTRSCFFVRQMSTLYLGNIIFDEALTTAHINAAQGSLVNPVADYEIVGGAAYHLIFDNNAFFDSSSKTYTLTGTPNFSGAFAWFNGGSTYSRYATTWSGAATGKRYNVTYNAVLRGGSATDLPGDVAGTTATGGQYGY